MADLTIENLRAFVLVMIALLALIVSVDKGIEAWKHLRGYQEKAEKERNLYHELALLRNRVTLCEERLSRGDAQFQHVAEDSKRTLIVLNAMLMHFISGNNNEKLKTVKAELDDYMAERR